jgi:ATP-dependent protease HslVU (ClpYQ) peptidase subunit
MTCIVALQHEGKVYIGGDSAGIDDNLSIVNRNDEKVFTTGEFAMGFTTSFRMGQILRYAFVPPEHPSKKDAMTYMVVDFIDAVRAVYKEKGYMGRESEGTAEEGGTFLVGYRNKLYHIDVDFQVAQLADGYSACGSGATVALGSLHSTRDLKDPIARCEMALEAAAHFNAGVRAPFKFVVAGKAGYIAPVKTASKRKR